MRTLLSLVVVALLFGCSTVRQDFQKTYTGADGRGYSITYAAKSTAAPFGEIKDTAHQWGYQFGDAEKITTGQNAAGIDNTNQTQAVKILADFLGAAIAAAIPVIGQMQAAHATPAPAQSTWLDSLAPLLPSLLDMFKAQNPAASSEPSLAVPPSIVITPTR